MKNNPSEHPLRLLFWELTARCNLKCRHCRAEAQEDFAEGELTTNEVVRVAKNIRAFADPIVVLTGGEPLVRDDIFEIATACTGLFSRVALATNGTLVDEQVAKRIVDSGIQRVSISLDGARAETHDCFRGLNGSFDGALSGYDTLRRVGASMQINVTVTKHNVTEMEDLLALALARGADAFHVFMLVPVGCGADITEEQRLSAQSTEQTLRWLFKKSLELKDRLHIKATCAPQYFRIMREVSRTEGITLPTHGHGMQATTRGCLAGSNVCFISRVGDVQPCGYLPISVGNVRERALGEIWEHADVFEALRDPHRLDGKCGRCEFRRVCQGCRARAYALSGDVLAEDPDCAYMPRT